MKIKRELKPVVLIILTMNPESSLQACEHYSFTLPNYWLSFQPRNPERLLPSTKPIAELKKRWKTSWSIKTTLEYHIKVCVAIRNLDQASIKVEFFKGEEENLSEELTSSLSFFEEGSAMYG
jgi:hypothetical protein